MSSALCSPSGPSLSATSALLEVGVKTGLSLLLTLLQQSWVSGSGGLCSSVLRTARDVLSALPPLALANETQMSRLGVDSLNQVTDFLLQAALPGGGADAQGMVA